MMKNKIKVIKKKDQNVETKNPQIKEVPEKEGARNMVSNVSSWVNEFQRRKREETKQAIGSLLTNRPESVSS